MRPSSKLLFGLFVALILPVAIAFSSSQPNADSDEPEPGVTNLRLASDGLSFELAFPAFEFDEAGVVSALGAESRLAQVGAPALPYYSTLIAVPPESTITVDVFAEDQVDVPVPGIMPAPTGVPSSLPLEGEFAPGIEIVPHYSADPGIYSQNQLYPQNLYRLSEPSYWRDVRLVRLDIFPLRYNPATQDLLHVRRASVSLTFEDARSEPLQPLPGPMLDVAWMDDLVLNRSQAQVWRHRPDELISAGETEFPIGLDTFKIELNSDGIYRLTGAALQAAGMDVANVDPQTLSLMWRGEPVAYQFVGNGNGQFEPTEYLLFYGWEFDGSRLETDYVTSNVFWIWADGTPTDIGSLANQNGFPTKDSFAESITAEPVNGYFSTWTNRWHLFPNEPDAWYWDLIDKSAGTIAVTKTFSLELHDPVTNTVAGFTAEFTSFPSGEINNVAQPHEVSVLLSGDPDSTGTLSWLGKANVNISGTITNGLSATGMYPFDVRLHSHQQVFDRVYLNRITVDYERHLLAVDDELHFGDSGGQREFQLQGFSSNDPNDVIVLNISDRSQPLAISIAAEDISGSGPYTYSVGVDDPAGINARYIATLSDNIMEIDSAAIAKYVPPDLSPPTAGADWLAIAYGDFVSEAERLAEHRAAVEFGGLSTQVVDVEDVINQYGYGLPLPGAINNYLSAALASWDPAPSYLLLVGDSTINPRQHELDHGNGGFGCGGSPCNTEPQLVPANLSFVDPFQGQVPEDTSYTLLLGGENDLMPDLTVGRIPAQTVSEVTAVVDKVIRFEEGQRSPQAWMENLLFVADDPDSGGNFCLENQLTSDDIPDHFNINSLCLPQGADDADVIALRSAMFDQVNASGEGVVIMNYRGHGSISGWGKAPVGVERILDTSMTGFWVNPLKTPILLSADCLDGHFAWAEVQGLGETFVNLADRGSVAHWSSSGLGYTVDHTVLHQGFYIGLFNAGATTIGDAVAYSKARYIDMGRDPSEFFSFTLLGDPAMAIMRQDLSVTKSASVPEASPGDEVSFTIEVTNEGIYSPPVVVTDTLPAELLFVSVNSPAPLTLLNGDNPITLQLTHLPWGETVAIEIVAQVDPDLAGNHVLINEVMVEGYGREIVPGDEIDFAQIIINGGGVYMPLINGQ